MATGLAAGRCRVREQGTYREIDVLPELEHLAGLPQNQRFHCCDVWEHTLAAVDTSPRQLAIRWALLLHDVAKGLPGIRRLNKEGQPSDHGHEAESAVMAEVILRDEDYDIKFYPGNGADRNNQIIATYLAWGRDFNIFLDGDKAGEDAKTRYIKEFGVVVHDSISTLKDVDPTFNIATEQLFTPQELLDIQKTFDPTATVFNKSAFNTALQNLFISEQVITLSNDTKEKFKKILDFLK